ncbi:ubiquitin carboxyl-terminal hydrolase 25-like [Plakobranchus ocellatus]|uniref:Ubiquitin carboxyl-terminal hydrolase 25-like n=1 Tax=Plakobranchus ocellatus TaxID=259542 RepID=A0AAV4CE77_9GAST|nr:ubiquitin carboxyl-terminal hydrolase 25-like [Plakobranchus ocellatus]
MLDREPAQRSASAFLLRVRAPLPAAWRKGRPESLRSPYCGLDPRPRDETLSLTLAKVREVTGASDEVIKEAIIACSCKDGTFKVEDVVTTIIGDDTVTTVSCSKNCKPQSVDDVDAKAGSPSSSSSSSSSSAPPVTQGHQASQVGQKKATSTAGPWKQTPQNNEYIDLTRDSQGILGGQISREEQDISRVLEASLAESKGSTKRKRGELWFIDPLNPHERKRTEGWPVGLRNVGNTCWFSAVIQSLFHIQKFRNIVLNYKSRPVTENENNHKLRFVCELRQLFGLMVGSHRKYVDPSMAVNILKEASSATALDGQQDVSEFQHKLLDWLEDAFSVPPGPSSASVPANPVHQLFQGKYKAEGFNQGSSASVPANPVHQLFQGKYKAEGFNQGKAFSQEVTFGQYPLNVLGFRDIHESLEATTAQGEIETVSGESSHKSGQEIWFTHLPVVLTFELSRFGFNQQLNRAEKIHQQLSFPPIIYVDRYLECNKTITRQKREEARKLKEELAALQAKLDRVVLDAASAPLSKKSMNYSEPVQNTLNRRMDYSDVQFGVGSKNSQDVSMSSVGEEQPPDDPAAATATATATTTTTALSTSVNEPKDSINQVTPSLSQTQGDGGPNFLHKPKIPNTSTPASLSSLSALFLCSSSSTSSASPAPEAKKFKDSSVQVEFEPRLMPVAMTTDSPQTQQFSSTAQPSHPLSSASLPPSSSSTSSDPSLPPNSQSLCSTSAPASLAHVDPSPLISQGSSSTLPLPPHPRSCSAEELVVLQACLKRWREEVEADVRELQRNISFLESKLDGMYSEECMKKYPYHLHAVLVHEGQAVSGHYWSFIHDWHHRSNSASGQASGSEGRWLKFNDITVSESSLAEVQREGVGGFHNASAYCLMYIDRSRLEAGQGDYNSSAAAAASAQSLPEDLQRVVEDDNLLFRQEMLQWDEEQRRKTAASVAPPHSSPAHGSSSASTSAAPSSATSSGVAGQKSTSTQSSTGAGLRQSEGKGQGRGRSLSGDPDVVMTGEQRPGETSIMRPVNSALAALADAHARLSLQATLTAVTDMHGKGNTSGSSPHPRDVLKGAMEREMMRLRGLSRTVASRLPGEDPRLSHIVLYLLTSGADSHTVRVILAEQFALCGLLDSASTVKGLRHEAQDTYKALYAHGGNEGAKCYEFWHKRYHHYRQAVLMFTEGITAYIAKKYQEALPYFNQACLHNCEPGLTSSLCPTDGLNSSWLAYYRRETLQKVNDLAMQSFERDDDLSDSLTVMTRMILPTLAMVGSSDRAEDQALVERIREVWCQFLEKDLTGEKIDKLQDFLSKMFEAGGTGSEELHRVRPSQLDTLTERYARTMRRLKETGDLVRLISLSTAS